MRQLRRLRRLVAALALLAAPAVPAGGQPPLDARVSHATLRAADGTVRDLWVYLPPGYDARRAGGYPLLLTFDADEYRAPDGMAVPQLLDSLLAAHAAPPFVAVMLANGDGAARVAELGNNPRYVRFLADELVPWIRGRWNVTRDARRTVVAGSSAGGLGAAFAALARPDVFGHVLAQSPAAWRGAEGSNAAPYEWLAAHVPRRDPAHDVALLLDVGATETGRTLGGAGPVFLDAVRRLRDALAAAGYRVRYTEVPGGRHAVASWRPRFAPDLVALVACWSR